MMIFGVFGVFSGKWPFLAIWTCIYIGFKRAYSMKILQNPLGTGPKMSKITVFAIFDTFEGLSRIFAKNGHFCHFWPFWGFWQNGHFGDFSVSVCRLTSGIFYVYRTGICQKYPKMPKMTVFAILGVPLKVY
jgi:hypothetical protein